MPEYLLIGGPRDGERISLEYTIISFQPGLSDGEYRHFSLGPCNTSLIYRHESLTADEAIQKLIEGYRPNE